MNTNDLITALATNDAAVGPDRPPKLGWMVGAGLASSVALLLVFWGVLTNLLATMQTSAFIAKIALGLLTAAVGLWLWPQLLKPSNARRARLLAVVAPTVLVWLWALLGTDTPVLSQALSGMWSTCSVSIAALALPVWLGLMWHAQRCAPTQLRLAGAVSGAIAGGLGAAVYSLYCPVFDAGYIAVWYVLGIGVCVAVGAWLGPRAMRW
jgi:hypothetical protein